MALPPQPRRPPPPFLCILLIWLGLFHFGTLPSQAAPESPLPRPGECALWAGQARLLARRLLEQAVHSERPELARFYVESAFQLSPAPPLLYNLGLLWLRSGHPVESADLLRRYQAEVGPELPADHRAVVSKALQPLPTPSYEVELQTTADAVVYVDDRLVGRAPLRTPLLLPSGPHRVRIELGYRHAEANVSDPGAIAAGVRPMPLRLPLPSAVVLIAPELEVGHERRLASLLTAQGITLVPARDRELLLSQLPDRTGCLTQTSCQLWLGEQLDVEHVMVVRSINVVGVSSERLSRLTLEVMAVPHGAQLFHRQTICPDCTPLRSEPFLQALARTVRRELPMLTRQDPSTVSEPAPVGFAELAPVRLSPCALARGTARRLARRLLVDENSVLSDSEARVRIETAYQLSPSPLLLYNLGLLYRRLGQPLLAAELLGRFMATAGTELTVERRAKAEATLSEPQPPSAQVLLTGPLGAMVFVDGKLHGSLPLESPLSLSPGSHRLLLESGYRTTPHELTVRAGEQLQLHLTLPDAVLLLPDEQAMSEVPELMSIARRAAEDAGLIVIPERDRELLVQSSTEYTGCERSLLCMRRVGKMLGAQSVIMLERRLSRVWAGRLVRSDDGALGSATSEGCASCTSDDLAIRRIIRQLIPRRQISQKPPGQPLLESHPSAVLSLDGFVLGSAPQRPLLLEGQYKLTAQLSPLRSVTGILHVPTDTSLMLRFSMEPPRRRSPRLALGALLITGGAVLVATGIGFWVDAARPTSPPLTAPESSPADRPGLIVGPILVAGGAASAIAGGVLLGLRGR